MDAGPSERLRLSARLPARSFAPPRDCVVLTADDPRLFGLAERLWDRGGGRSPLPALDFEISVRPGLAPGSNSERALIWTRTAQGWEVALETSLAVRIDLVSSRVTATVFHGLLEDDPALAARYLLEAPAAVLLSRRVWQVLHAGAVVGSRGAIVIRGGPGAGKSTLVAAAWKAGFSVLADESLLVAREDTDELAASVRDLTLRDDAAAMLGLDDQTAAAFSGGEAKRRINLWTSSSPVARRARRIATVLLGDRERTPARIVPLPEDEFVASFRAGEIPQERDGGDPDPIATAWSAGGGFRLDGACDLVGAIAALARFML